MKPDPLYVEFPEPPPLPPLPTQRDAGPPPPIDPPEYIPPPAFADLEHPPPRLMPPELPQRPTDAEGNLIFPLKPTYTFEAGAAVPPPTLAAANDLLIDPDFRRPTGPWPEGAWVEIPQGKIRWDDYSQRFVWATDTPSGDLPAPSTRDATDPLDITHQIYGPLPISPYLDHLKAHPYIGDGRMDGEFQNGQYVLLLDGTKAHYTKHVWYEGPATDAPPGTQAPQPDAIHAFYLHPAFDDPPVPDPAPHSVAPFVNMPEVIPPVSASYVPPDETPPPGTEQPPGLMISGLDPSSIYANELVPIVVWGWGFTEASQVRFGTEVRPTTFTTENRLDTDYTSATTGDVEVVVVDGTLESEPVILSVTELPRPPGPALDSVTPASTEEAAMTSFTLVGGPFTVPGAKAFCSLNGGADINLPTQRLTETEIDVMLQPGSVGSIEFWVENPDRGLSDRLTVPVTEVMGGTGNGWGNTYFPNGFVPSQLGASDVYNHSIANKFTVMKDGHLVAVGVYIPPGETLSNHWVRLMDETGTAQIRGISISSTTAGWQWKTVGTPLVVTAGQVFVVKAEYVTGGQKYGWEPEAPVGVDPGTRLRWESGYRNIYGSTVGDPDTNHYAVDLAYAP